MISHIERQAQKTVELLKAGDFRDLPQSYVEVLVEELNRLDSRDFVAAARWDFLNARRRARRVATISVPEWILLAALAKNHDATTNDIHVLHRVADALEMPLTARANFGRLETAWAAARDILESAVKFFGDLATILTQGYGGEASYIDVRSFAWIKNRDLRKIVVRDYKELMLNVHPSGAWKMTVVAAGSILEAILYDLLTRTRSRISAAMKAASVPKKKDSTGAKIPRDIKKNKGEDQWDLNNLIKVANELGLLPEDRAYAIDQTLRDWRNFVHPHKEIKADYEISDGEAMTAVGNLKCVCDHLEKKSR
jgi:hypothetical protein